GFHLHVTDLHFLVFLPVFTLLGDRMTSEGGGHAFAIHADFVGFLVAGAIADQHPASTALVSEHDVHGVGVLDHAVTFSAAGLAADGLGVGLLIFPGEHAGGEGEHESEAQYGQ